MECLKESAVTVVIDVVDLLADLNRKAGLKPRVMGDGRWVMGDGRWEMGDGRWEMGDGR